MKIIFIGIVAVSLAGNLFAGYNEDMAYLSGSNTGYKIPTGKLNYYEKKEGKKRISPIKYCEEETMARYGIVTHFAKRFYSGCISTARRTYHKE